MQAAINDLADLNNQIDNSIVKQNVNVSDGTAHTVSLTPAEVDRLGEGSVQIEATQTDAVGNLHEGVAATTALLSTRLILRLSRLRTISQALRLMVRTLLSTR